MSFETIAVIGLGYIGLPTAAMFASRKKKVIGIDVNRKAVDTINQGRIHIVEPDLDIAVHAAVTQGYLRASTLPEAADAFLIAVPTPFKDGHRPDLDYVKAATRSIAPVLRKDNLVVLESTSPVGTTEKVAGWLAEARPDLRFPGAPGTPDVYVAHCPERVLPGKVMTELINNDRVIGGLTARCAERAETLYRIFVQGECLLTDARTAEMCKLTENSFRDVNIAFANELSIICDKLGINIWELIKLANRHPRVNILKPGPGVGGHCIAVDPWFIVDSAKEEARLIRTAREVNDGKPEHVVAKIRSALQGRREVGIACLGLSFKADIDDLRESPALHIVERLGQEFANPLWLVEPHISELPKQFTGRYARLVSAEQAILHSQVVVILVDHRAFQSLEPGLLSGKTVIDTRGIVAGIGPGGRQHAA